MKKKLFQALALVNKLIVPRMSKKDLTKLTKMQKAVVAYRYWVTTQAIE